MCILKKFWVGVFIIFSNGLLSMVYAFDLVEAYRNALVYNADYLRSIAENTAGQEKQVQGLSALLPQISVNGAYNENYVNLPATANGGVAGFFHQPVLGATLNQVIFDFSKFSTYTKAKYETQIADLKLQDAKQKLIGTVVSAYFDILYASDNLEAIRMQKNAFEKQMNNAKKAFEVGTVSIADVNDAQANYDAQNAKEIQAGNDLLNRKTIFRNLTGLNPDLIQPLVDNIDLINPVPNTAEAWSNVAQENNITIKVLGKKLEMAKEDINIAKSGHMPTLNAVANVNYQGLGVGDYGNGAFYQAINSVSNQYAEQTTGAVGLSLNIPIYSGGLINSQVREAIANFEVAEQDLTANKRQVDQSIRNAFWQVENGVNFVKAQNQALKSSQLQLKSVRLGYQVGVRNSIDLVISEKAYAAILLDYNKARYDYLNYRLQLKYLTGQIDENYLKQININIKH
ncbi:MAG TPA: TolC family outer membrane protein [Burkholderiales bacterium]|nr:TolC family outer membrane protein [Burkholderiales bacterium]